MNRCLDCAWWDEDTWGCRQHGIRVVNRDPHLGEPHHAIAFGPRKNSRVSVAVGPFFGCVHWQRKEVAHVSQT